ncbi:UNVERIFIED_CONTAM: hydrolase 76 protein, partial [Siphonaria sp. JEL0065]
MQLQNLILPLCIAARALAQQNIDLTRSMCAFVFEMGFTPNCQILQFEGAVVAAAKASMGPLKQFFVSPNIRGNGAWTEQYDDGHWLVQWHESGIYWDLFYQYMQYSGDTTHLSFVDKNIQTASIGGDFLDGANPFLELAGRWNDDIAWWGITAARATQIFGQKAVVASDNIQAGFNPTYFTLANATFYQVFNQWDNLCGGGIYWSRTRAEGTADPTLKSTITNVEEMEIAAKLYSVTKDADFKTKFDQIFAWLKSSGIIAGDYVVYDGIRTGGCAISPNIYSYYYGELFAALGEMYTLTKQQSYLDEGNKLFT